jgi:nucleoside 2-deoxyribosyltransferase
MIRVYLAGPDVFLPDPVGWLDRKKAICSKAGLLGVSPLDRFDNEPAEWATLSEWQLIAARNEAHIRSCAAVIANLTPFRGPSADAGTVYEIGFARGIGRPVFAYATTDAPFLQRTLRALNGTEYRDDAGDWRDADGMQVEEFGLFDNLMIEAAIVASGQEVVCRNADPWRDLSVFTDCVSRAARILKDRRG